jgi:exosortase/archaeosortase family protein
LSSIPCEPVDVTAATHSPVGRSIDWRPWVRPAVALTLIVIAYRTSLTTLFESMRLDTPLAHLALVPLIALALAAVYRRADTGPSIHDRQLDWIVGLFLAGTAAAANVVLPARLSTKFWEYRIDLLTLPFFTAGVVTLLFGVRTLWRNRLAVSFLFLAWPYPFTRLLDRWLGDFTQGTVWALDQTLQHIALASKVAGSDTVFQVTGPHNDPIQMSVASACSGANGLVGFLLVAGAFALVVDGSRMRKTTWLLCGAFLVWLLNVLRILIIFGAAGRFGETVAIEGFHPYMGLVVFNIGVLIMVILMKPFGLSFRLPPAAEHADRESAKLSTNWSALACVGILALGVSVYNSDLRAYDRVANSFGEPRLASFAESRETPADWTLHDNATYDWAKRFFGKSSTWHRYNYIFSGSTAATLSANVPITVDVIETSDRAALEAYGIEDCYKFHGYSIHGRQSVDLGSGVTGGMLTWTSEETSLTWTTLYWHWPIKTATGTRYERVTLVMNDQTTNSFTSPPVATDTSRQLQLDINDVLRGTGSPEDRARLLQTRQFMVGFARNLIQLRAPAPSTV